MPPVMARTRMKTWRMAPPDGETGSKMDRFSAACRGQASATSSKIRPMARRADFMVSIYRNGEEFRAPGVTFHVRGAAWPASLTEGVRLVTGARTQRSPYQRADSV